MGSCCTLGCWSGLVRVILGIIVVVVNRIQRVERAKGLDNGAHEGL